MTNQLTGLLLVLGTLASCNQEEGSMPRVEPTPAKVEPAPCPLNTGLMTTDSAHSFEDTLTLLEKAIETKGLTLFTRIDHADNASNAGLSLQPTTVVLFGNPKAGTPLMQSSRTTAIDLPQKMLVWVDDNGTHLTYNAPSYLADRHGITDQGPRLNKIAELLAGLASEAAAQ